MKIKKILVGFLTTAMILSSGSNTWATETEVTATSTAQNEGNVEVTKEDAENNAVEIVDGNSYADLQSAVDAATGTGNTTIKLLKDITIDSPVNIEKKTITIIGNGHTINVKNKGTIQASDGATLNLGDGKNSLIICGTLIRSSETGNNSERLVAVKGVGTRLNMFAGVTIQKGFKGGVIVQDGAEFNMNGGTITNNYINKDTLGGGGICALAAKVHVQDGIVSYNIQRGGIYGHSGGGGIFGFDSDIYIGGNAIIRKNWSRAMGGGIYVIGRICSSFQNLYSPTNIDQVVDSFHIEGNVSIKENYAGVHGGGLFVNGITDSVISGDNIQIINNEAHSQGGGFMTSSSCLTTFSGNVHILNNKSSSYCGGGIRVEGKSRIAFNNPITIYGNTSGKAGNDISNGSTVNAEKEGIQNQGVLYLYTPSINNEYYAQTGHYLDGWYLDEVGNRYDPKNSNSETKDVDVSEPITDEINLVASYRNGICMLTYELDGGSFTEEQENNLTSLPEKNISLNVKHDHYGDWAFTYGNYVSDNNPINIISEVPHKDGYYFGGWECSDGMVHSSGEKYGNRSGETNNGEYQSHVLKAIWNTEPELKTYTVTYIDGVNGAAFSSQSYTVNEGSNTPAFNGTATRRGYTFTGWSPIVTDTVTADVTYTAQWRRNAIPSVNPGSNKTSVTPSTSLSDTPSATSVANTPQLNTVDHEAFVNGYPDGTIHPTGSITRAETAAMFARLLTPSVRDTELAKLDGTDSYTDVNVSKWYYSAVTVMKSLGIVFGKSDGSFSPNAPITRAEFATMAERFNVNEVSTTGKNFSDISGHWAENSIKRAASDGWVDGYPDGTFHPNNTITRAEAMAIINRVLLRYPESTTNAFGFEGHPYRNVWKDNMDKSKWYYLDIQEATNSHDYVRGANKFPKRNFYKEKWTAINKAPDWSQYHYKVSNAGK